MYGSLLPLNLRRLLLHFDLMIILKPHDMWEDTRRTLVLFIALLNSIRRIRESSLCHSKCYEILKFSLNLR